MLVEVKVPQLSESVTGAALVTWHRKIGEYVERDENLVDIETDKVALETPAPESGVLASIIKGDGGTVVSTKVWATSDRKGKPRAVSEGAAGPAAQPQRVSRSAKAPEPSVMPAARKLAEDRKIDVASLAGSGRGGRVTKADVLAAMPADTPPAATAATARTPPRVRAPAPAVDLGALGEHPEQRGPMSRLRARIAERLVQSQSTAAILTTFNEVNMQPVIDLRNRYKVKFEQEHGIKLGFMSFFVKAAVAALKRYPIVNASIDGNDIIYHGYFDIGIAVGSARGLVVPIIRNADQMSFAEIETQIADFGQRTQDGKLSIEELTGGTFSISNGGIFGSMLSTPIINPPQSAILGVHATRERPVVEGGQIVIRPMNYLALSYHHRIIDGREAVLSLVAMKEALEDPARMLLDILMSKSFDVIVIGGGPGGALA